MLSEFKLELARKEHAETVCKLVNQAYRGQYGWTNETDIVDGDRTDIDEILSLISSSSSILLIAIIRDEIASCICIEKDNNQAYIGLFSVSPAYQNIGLGKQVLDLAESYALNQFDINRFVMVVISQRKELISFYERRGYKRTGEIKEYPVHLNVGNPRVKGLTIECLEKNHITIACARTEKIAARSVLCFLRPVMRGDM